MTALDDRAYLARKLADTNRTIAQVSLEADTARFATPAELQAFRDGLTLARTEVTAAESVLHDLTLAEPGEAA